MVKNFRERALTTVGLLALALSCAPVAAATATLPPTVELRQVGELLVPFQSGMPIPTYEPQLRPSIDLSDGWRRRPSEMDHTLSLSARTPEVLAAIERESGGAYRADYDDRSWASSRLPETPVRGFTEAEASFGPSGLWYRRRVSIPPLWKGRRVLLHCLAANYVADVWVNGRYVGYHEGGFTPFSFDITGEVRWGDTNVIALRVDNPAWGAEGKDAVTGEMLPPGPGDWRNATGVLRDIYLEAVPETALVRADIRAQPAAGGTRLRVQVVVRQAGGSAFSGQVDAQVFPALVAEANLTTPSAAGLLGGGAAEPVVKGKPQRSLDLAPDSVSAFTLDFATPALAPWSPDDPALYVLQVTLRDGEGREVDRIASQFGVRTLETAPRGSQVLLNGEAVRLCGVARVEDDPHFGRSETFRDGLRVLLDLRFAKRTGTDLLHLGRFVNHPLTTLLADRIGLLCWEEIPAYKLGEDALVTQRERRHLARQMLIEMIYQDYNRPSVGFWGVCDDPTPGQAAEQFIRDLSDIAHYLDGTRLVALSAPIGPSYPGSADCDVWGISLPDEAADAKTGERMLSQVDALHRARPDKPLMITRFSAPAGDDPAAAQRQARAAENLAAQIASRSYLAGWVWWTLSDYRGARGLRETGLLSRRRREIRPVAAALRQAYERIKRGKRPEPP